MGKVGLSRAPEGLLTVAVILLASGASFGLGMLAERSLAGEGGGVKIEQLDAASSLPAAASEALAPVPTAPKTATPAPKVFTKKAAPTGTATAATGKYVASKNGTKFYLPSCATANRINEENKIYFTTEEEAEAAGFQPSSTCKGL